MNEEGVWKIRYNEEKCERIGIWDHERYRCMPPSSKLTGRFYTPWGTLLYSVRPFSLPGTSGTKPSHDWHLTHDPYQGPFVSSLSLSFFFTPSDLMLYFLFDTLEIILPRNVCGVSFNIGGSLLSIAG